MVKRTSLYLDKAQLIKLSPPRKANSELTDIFKNERARITILESETVNMLYPHIVPVKLDEKITEYVFCTKCDTFMARAVVQKSDLKGMVVEHYLEKGVQRWQKRFAT